MGEDPVCPTCGRAEEAVGPGEVDELPPTPGEAMNHLIRGRRAPDVARYSARLWPRPSGGDEAA